MGWFLNIQKVGGLNLFGPFTELTNHLTYPEIIMKIKCEKGCDAKQVLQFVTEYIEKIGLEYPVLAEDLEIELTLKDPKGELCPDNGKTIRFEKTELEQVHSVHGYEDYYNHDVLTGLYTRGKFERDLSLFRLSEYHCLSCVYIDAVGLHEINNHLGHKAGDQLLCSVADGLRKYFPNSLSYRIGGDEFVILCPEHSQEQVQQQLTLLKDEIREKGYEISTGVDVSTNSSTLHDTVNQAEKAMRYDKMSFYRNNGGARQMRMLNYKLEKLLLETQDASHFLNVIAPRYKGVYMVNPDADTCRYIYLPPYFQKMLEHNKGVFSLAMREYCYTLVRPEYYDSFEMIYHYRYIAQKLAAGHSVGFTYQKLDGSWVELKITDYDQNTANPGELLWIFLDENKEA